MYRRPKAMVRGGNHCDDSSALQPIRTAKQEAKLPARISLGSPSRLTGDAELYSALYGQSTRHLSFLSGSAGKPRVLFSINSLSRSDTKIG